MNQKIDFGNLGGFPLTQDTLDFMQQSYRNAIAGLARLAGEAVIVSGLTEIGANVSDGWIVYNGELLPFQAGIKQDYFLIIEEKGNEQFEDGNIRTVYFTKFARFGSGIGAISYSSLTRLDSIVALKAGLNNLNAALNNLNSTLNTHIANTNNPHSTTKVQVGLSNIPNKISDAINENKSDQLATSKAVYDLSLSLNKIHYVGAHYIGDIQGENLFTIPIPNISTGYIVIGNLRGINSWVSDNDVFHIVLAYRDTYFQLAVREISGDVQYLFFDFIVVKQS